MKYKLVIFDFDGTLADSFEWFINVMDKAADKYHFRKIEKNKIKTLRNSDAEEMIRYHSISYWKLPFIGKYLRKLMAEEIHKISLFEGIENVLKSLSDKGFIIAIVTSNLYNNVYNVLGTSNSSLINYFEYGIPIFGKDSRIKKILKQSGVKNAEAIFIGDEIRDIEAARKAKVKFGAVSWGYTNLEALKVHSPDEIFNNVEEIIEKIL